MFYDAIVQLLNMARLAILGAPDWTGWMNRMPFDLPRGERPGFFVWPDCSGNERRLSGAGSGERANRFRKA